MRSYLVLLLLLISALGMSAQAVVVESVTTANPDGVYVPGNTITVSVVFSGPVTVLTSPTGSPELFLNAQPGGVAAAYLSTTAGNQVNFQYTVGAGDSAQPLEVFNTLALVLNGGSISDASSNPAVLTLPAPGAVNSLSSGHDLSIETGPSVATISNITANASSPDGNYGMHKTVLIDVVFSEQVFLVNGQGQPTLTLDSHSGGTAKAIFSSGGGTNTLEFSYTPSLGDAVGDLDVLSFNAVTSPQQVVCGTATGIQNVNATVPTPGLIHSLSFNRNIGVETTQPTILNVTSTPSTATYGINATVPISVTFSTTVFVTGTPTVTLATGSADTVVSYSGGSGTSVLLFNYIVGAGQNTSQLDYILATGSPLQQPFSANTGTIRDIATNDADLSSAPLAGTTGSLVPNTDIVIDTTPPVVSNVTAVESPGTYGSGAIHIKVNFSEKVTVTGTPTLKLNTGTANDSASYTSGSGTSSLVFTYTILPGDVASPLNYTTILDLALNGGSIQDLAANQAILNLPDPASGSSLSASGIIIDTPAAVVSITSPSSTSITYGINGTISVHLNFSKAVTIAGGIPTLQLNAGTSASIATAAYNALASTPTVVDFDYTVRSGDSANPLDILSQNALLLNGATITGPGSVPAVLSLPSPGSIDSLSGAVILIVNGVAPVITSITSVPSTKSYHATQTIPITITFNEPVFVTGVPGLSLSVIQGSQNAVATYAGGSGTATLLFTYTVQAGENDPHLDENGSILAFNGGSIADAASNPSSGTLPATGSPASLAGSTHIIINTASPSVVSVTSPTTTYGAGQSIPITVTFSEAVTVDTTLGTPSLGLNLGHAATYTSGSGTTALVFSYTVLTSDPSENPLNYTSTFALQANLGIIEDSAGNVADLTLPALTSTNALSASGVAIDTSSPTVTSLNTTTANGVYSTGATINLVVSFNVPVSVTGGTPSLALNTLLNQGVATYASGSGSSTLNFTYTVAAGQNSVLLDSANASALQANGATITDQFGNPANLTVPIGANAVSLASECHLSVTTTADTVAPSVVSITSPTANGTYNTGDTIRLIVTYSMPVTVVGNPYIVMNDQGGSGSLPVANYSASASKNNEQLEFDYVVQSGNTTALLDTLENNALIVSGSASIKDPYDTANLLLPSPGASNSLSGTSQIQIDPSAPDGKPPANTLTTSAPSSGGCGVGGGAAIIGMLSLAIGARQRTARSRK
jgi:hypothetical protein